MSEVAQTIGKYREVALPQRQRCDAGEREERANAFCKDVRMHVIIAIAQADGTVEIYADFDKRGEARDCFGDLAEVERIVVIGVHTVLEKDEMAWVKACALFQRRRCVQKSDARQGNGVHAFACIDEGKDPAPPSERGVETAR